MPRRSSPWIVGALVAVAGCASPEKDQPAADGAHRIAREVAIRFEGGTWGGPPPAEFVPTDSGAPGPPGRWILTPVEGPAVAAVEQCDGDATVGRFPMLVYEPLAARDVEVWVRFQAVSGRVDQAAGIAFRVQDASNYYVARANALENDVRLFKVVAGERIEIAARDAAVTTGTWHMLKVSARGPLIDVALDGVGLLEARDTTFPGPGRIALWTKADSVTKFTALKIETYDAP